VFDERQAQALVDRAYGIALNGAAHPTVAELKSDLLEAGAWPRPRAEHVHAAPRGTFVDVLDLEDVFYDEDHNFD
jgi:hypothetical protein